MRVQVNDTRLFFDTEGSEFVVEDNTVRRLPTAILVPGGPGQSHLHHKVIPPIPAGMARVIHYDHRGCGRSDRSTRDEWNLRTWTSDLAGLCEALEIERPIILGTSFGAVVALAFAQEYPDRVSKLVLVSGVARFIAGDMLDVFERLGGTDARSIADRFYRRPGPDTIREFQRVCAPLYARTPLDPERTKPVKEEPFNVKLFFHWALGEARTVDLRPNLSSIRCPTLILAGEDDPAAPASASREIAAGIDPELVTLRVFSDCGHNPLHDARSAALEEIRSFVA